MVRAVFPGTFDPIHFGHIDIACRAARIFDEVIIAVYDKPLKSLLFSPKDRIELVKQSFVQKDNIKVMGYSGLTVQFCQKIPDAIKIKSVPYLMLTIASMG